MLQRLAIDRGAILYDPRRVAEPGAPALRPGVLARARRAARTCRPGAARSSSSKTRAAAGCCGATCAAALRRASPVTVTSGSARTVRGPSRNCACCAALHARGLPVPPPVAGRYLKAAFTYRAELITERLAGARSMEAVLAAGPMDDARWDAIGRCLRRFHDAGVQHADLNARNIMLGEQGEVWVLDFDRGRQRAPGRLERPRARPPRAQSREFRSRRRRLARRIRAAAPRARRVRRDVLPL